MFTNAYCLVAGGVQQRHAARRAVGAECQRDAAVAVARGPARAALRRLRAPPAAAAPGARRLQPHAHPPVCVPGPSAASRALHTAYSARHGRCICIRRSTEYQFYRLNT